MEDSYRLGRVQKLRDDYGWIVAFPPRSHSALAGGFRADSVFFHRDNTSGFDSMYEGDAVMFTEVSPEPAKGPRARHVRKVNDGA